MEAFKKGDRVRLTREVLGYPAGTEVEYFAPHAIKDYHTLVLAEGKTLCPRTDHFTRLLSDEEIARDVAVRQGYSPVGQIPKLILEAFRLRDERDKEENHER